MQGMTAMPWMSPYEPKVKRGTAVFGSSPTVETRMPAAPERMPLPMFSGVMTAMVESPKRQSQKVSGPPKRRAKRASDAAKQSRKSVPTMPPKAEDRSEV